MRARYRMVAGEAYKINLLNKNDIIYREDTSCCTRALVKYKANQRYDTELVVTDPTIEELMYFMTKGGKKV